MNNIESAYESGASIESLVLSCAAAIKSVPWWDAHASVRAGIAAAESWATGDGLPGAVRYWQDRLPCSRRAIEDAAYWAIAAAVAASDGFEQAALGFLRRAMMYLDGISDRDTVEAIIRSVLEPRDTIPCPPSAECVEHGRAA